MEKFSYFKGGRVSEKIENFIFNPSLRGLLNFLTVSKKMENFIVNPTSDIALIVVFIIFSACEFLNGPLDGVVCPLLTSSIEAFLTTS